MDGDTAGWSQMNGSEIRALRKSARVSQFRLAGYLGITSAQLSEWESGKATPTTVQLRKVAEALRHADQLVEAGEIQRGRRPTPVAHRGPRSPGLSTRCCSEPSKQAGSPSAIALFAGCGGLALGFKQAGFLIKGFIEIEPAARSTFKRNFPEADCLAHDILEFDAAAPYGSDGEVDVLIGGPPCQGFSLAGKRDPKDHRNQLFREYARIASLLNPKLILMENVRLLMSMRDHNGEFVIDQIRKSLRLVGYSTAVWVVNAQDFGIPQSRERVFVVGVRDDLDVNPELFGRPPVTHVPGAAPPSLLDPPQERLRTFRDATSDLKSLESGEADPNDPMHWAVRHPDHVIEWLRDVPEGCSAHDNEDPALRPPSGYNTTYKRLAWDKPSSTIGTTFGMISGSRNVHPTATRSLTVREASRCQTFPDDFCFEGTWGEIRTMIGNAVPPLLAKQWAEHLQQSGLLTS
jgi:DNA (cytosine-5)-methyltransferase 1